MRIQAVRVTANKYTPARTDLPRVHDYSHKSSCPFLPQSDPEPTSYEWTKFIHPNGTVYWYNRGRSTILANHAYDFTNEDQRRCLVTVMDALWAGVRPNTIAPMSSASATATTSVNDGARADYELFIDIDHKSSVSPVRYYFADWGCCSVFWLKPQSLFHAISKEHLAAKLKNQFWTHVAAYPMHHPLPPGSIEELRSIVGYSLIDSIRSLSSIVLWTTQDAQRIMSSLEQGSGQSMDSRPNYLAEGTSLSNAAIALLWQDIWDYRASNYYGDPRAKVSRFEYKPHGKEPVYHAVAKTICSLIFFNRPSRIASELDSLFSDDTLYLAEWRVYMEKEIEPEWQGTQAAIMLAANMAFLALDSVQEANDGPFLACKTLCLSSTTFSVAALFATLKLARTHQRWKSLTVEEASDYMTYCSERMLGLFGLGMVYSIPFAMFMWSLFTFVAAVLLYAFQHWTRDAELPLITATVAPIVVLLVWEWWFFDRRPRHTMSERHAGEVQELKTANTANIPVVLEPAHYHSTPNTFARRNLASLLAAFTPAYGRGKKRLQVDVEMDVPATPNELSTSSA